MELDAMVNAAPLRQVQQVARDAAAAGFSGLVITEAGRTAYLSCAAAALAADLDLATGVAVAFPRSPMVTASTAWELADTTGGRFRLGLGTQVKAHITRRYAAEFDPPGPRLREYVAALRAIFRAFAGEEKLSFEGDYWQFSLLPPEWSPGPLSVPPPPIDIAAVNPWMLRTAGEVADGVHVHPLNSPTYLRTTVLPELARGAAKAGRDVADLAVIVPCFTAVGDTEEERAPWRDTARFQIAFYGSTPNYGYIFEQLGAPGTGEALNERMRARDYAGMANLITDDLLAHFLIECAWDDLADRVIERYRGIATRVVLYFAGSTWQRDRHAFARLGEIGHAVRAAG